jgi:Disulphide isomerase
MGATSVVFLGARRCPLTGAVHPRAKRSRPLRCGCAAGRTLPGIALALKHTMAPDIVATVCVGGDLEAIARVREGLQDDPPSSPSAARCRIVRTAGG